MYGKKFNNHLSIIDKYKGNYGANMVGIYLESPFVSMEKRGMIKREFIIKNTENYKKIIHEILNICKKLKVITVAPEIKNGLKIIGEFKKQGIIVCFGHSMADYFLTKKDLNYSLGLSLQIILSFFIIFLIIVL